MVAYIELNDDTTEQWYVGETDSFNYHDVVSIQAEGDELSVILNNIGGIPIPPISARVVTWFGSDAKFIAQFLHHIPIKTE